ncbi:MAG: dual specificity protein phosphatase family protein [Candidatus Omnitrophica bacterium]|nr:dual specificity protein phosphatase family protein [Candidatus Omnitrophota bacterium]
MNLRIFLIPFMIGTFVSALCPSAVFSQEEDALAQLKQKAYNFREVAPGIYRSGLIPAKVTPMLKDLGIRTVLNFDNNRRRAEEERKRLEQLGIEMIWMPWSGWDAPSDEVISESLSLLESKEHKPILVHCKHGQERTGVAIASWRIKEQGWTFDRAYQEMKVCNFRPFRYGHLKRYVCEFAQAHGDKEANCGSALEQMKTDTLSSFYQLRKWNPFLKRDL